jgi:hypothetical protein
MTLGRTGATTRGGRAGEIGAGGHISSGVYVEASPFTVKPKAALLIENKEPAPTKNKNGEALELPYF